MTAAFWESVLELGSFNTHQGRMVQREAVAKLKKLDKELEPKLLARVVAFYLEDAPYDLWPALKHVRKEHAPTVAAALAKSKELQARFACAAYERDPVAGLQRAGEIFAAFAKCSHLPGLWKSLTKNWDKLPASALADAAVAVLEDRKKGPDLTEIMPLYGLVFIVAKAQPKAPLLDVLRERSARWKGWEDTVERAITAAQSATGERAAKG
ncbi:MAG: hypothetical protein U0271_06175 [Polyangiaceae bacterium]